MRDTSPIRFLSKRGICTCALALGLACPALCFPAQATDSPFEINAERWTKPKNYQTDIKPLPDVAPQESAVASPEPKTPPAPTTTPAPIVVTMPTMPGLNKGFDMRVNSTEEAKRKEPIAAKPEATPDIHLQDKNWKSPPVSGHAAKTQQDDDEDQENPALNVRMSFLPAQNITPIPDAPHESARKRGHALLRKSAPNTPTVPTRTPEESAACAALDAYKQQQLDAIQSDRQTLKALQDAVHSLGMTKQLDFTAGHDSVLNASNAEPATSQSVPMPISIR